MKKAERNLTFIIIELSETSNGFVKIRLVLEIKNVASFIKTHFYLKQGYIKIQLILRSFAVFLKLTFGIFVPTSLFSKQKFKVYFSNVTSTKTRPCASLLFI